MAEPKFDFSGWVTKYNVKCTDGRTIRNNAFAHMDGEVVPLVMQHTHDDPEKILGKVYLEHRDAEGLYGYASLNNNPKAVAAREAVRHGDLNSFSIFANHLSQTRGNVMHGDVKEVSLVICGANAGAKIDYPVLTHSGMITFVDTDAVDGDIDDFEEARISAGSYIEHSDLDDVEYEYEEVDEDEIVEHADDDEDETVLDVYEAMSDKQKAVVAWYVQQAIQDNGGESVSHADDSDDEEFDEDETVADVYNAMSKKQQLVVAWYVDQALKNGSEEVKHSDLYDEGEYEMKNNVFDETGASAGALEITHADMAAIIKVAQKNKASLKETLDEFLAEEYLAHADGEDVEYGIQNLEIMFPDAVAYDKEPNLISRNDSWVSKVLDGTTHRPFARIKTIHADITEDEARAKGYTKGNRKIEEVFKVLKRVTTPDTIYKKQKLDRDDILDCDDFNVIAFLKKEMKFMLDEEVARAILFGDGRSSMDNDKIKEDNIRPVVSDDALYTIQKIYTFDAGNSEDDAEANKAKQFIKQVIKSRREWKGTGTPKLFITEEMLTACLLLEDGFGRALYDTEEKLRTKLRVSEIVPFDIGEEVIRDAGNGHKYLVDGVLLNPADYVVGAVKGGEVATFEDFDINYNQEIMLMELRMSGALTKAYSAIVYQTEKTA